MCAAKKQQVRAEITTNKSIEAAGGVFGTVLPCYTHHTALRQKHKPIRIVATIDCHGRVCVLPHATAFTKIANMQKTRQRFAGGRYSRSSGLLWAMCNTYIGQSDVHNKITAPLALVHPPRQTHRAAQHLAMFLLYLFVCAIAIGVAGFYCAQNHDVSAGDDNTDFGQTLTANGID